MFGSVYTQLDGGDTGRGASWGMGNGVWGSHGHAGYLFDEYDVCGGLASACFFARPREKYELHTWRCRKSYYYYLNDGSIEI